MSLVKTPYNDLQGDKTTGGTWTLETVGGPAAPGTYNGTVTFTTEPEGEYTYKYTTTTGTATDEKYLTYDWRGVREVRANSLCVNAAFLGTPISVPATITFTDDSLGDCQSKNGPTTSAELPATEWGTPVGGFSGDLWYQFFLPYRTTEYNIVVTVDGTIYADSSIKSVALEAMRGSDCSTLSARTATVNPNFKTATVAINVPAMTTGELFFFRVASYAGQEGKFDVTITLQ